MPSCSFMTANNYCREFFYSILVGLSPLRKGVKAPLIKGYFLYVEVESIDGVYNYGSC